ncbi:MAG TPA: phosphatase PAP2 family protein [Pyrinomonadaceae bacterium]|nr:phosphatase PAP2 family protein [Pyrinomonadaceae bacterium]
MKSESELRESEVSAADDTFGQTPRERLRAARRLLRAEVYYGASLLAFAALTFFAYTYAYFGWDLRAARAVQSLTGLREFMRVVSIPGDGWTAHVISAVTVLMFLAVRRYSEGAALALSTGGGAILSRTFKVLIARPRPAPELVDVFRAIESKSFPSGHVTFYVCYFGFLYFVAYATLPRGSFARRAALALTAAPVLLVGLSRVHLGEHWPSDTLGAYLMSGTWLALTLEIYRRWKKPSPVTGTESGA